MVFYTLKVRMKNLVIARLANGKKYFLALTHGKGMIS